jgi:hypothetical protein
VILVSKLIDMSNIQLIQVTPEELASIISEQVSKEIQSFAVQLQQPTINHDRPHMTRKETAEFFGVSLNCINDWSKSGFLRPLKMSNRTYFLRSECMDTLLNSRRA